MLVVISLFMSITTFTEIRREKTIFRAHLEELGLMYLNSVKQVYIETGGEDEARFARLMIYSGSGAGLPEISQLDLYARDGERLVAEFKPTEDTAAATNASNWPKDYGLTPVLLHGDDYLDVKAPIVSKGEVLGFIHFRMSSSSVESAIRYLAISALVQAMVLITIALPITYIVAQRFTRPIKTLAKAAESVGAGSLDDDLLTVYKQNDEIGDLNVAFADMVGGAKRVPAQVGTRSGTQRAVRKDGSSGQTGQWRRPRDQQPASRHSGICAAWQAEACQGRWRNGGCGGDIVPGPLPWLCGDGGQAVRPDQSRECSASPCHLSRIWYLPMSICWWNRSSK